MMQIAQGQSALLPMAGLQRKQGHVWQVFSSPWDNNKQLAISNKRQLENGLENVPAIQMGPKVPPNMNTKHYQTTGRHAPQSSLEFSVVLSFGEKERTTTHGLRLHTITQTASIFFQTVFVRARNTAKGDISISDHKGISHSGEVLTENLLPLAPVSVLTYRNDCTTCNLQSMLPLRFVKTRTTAEEVSQHLWWRHPQVRKNPSYLTSAMPLL